MGGPWLRFLRAPKDLGPKDLGDRGEAARF